MNETRAPQLALERVGMTKLSPSFESGQKYESGTAAQTEIVSINGNASDLGNRSASRCSIIDFDLNSEALSSSAAFSFVRYVERRFTVVTFSRPSARASKMCG